MSSTRETIADVRAQRSELTQKVQNLELALQSERSITQALREQRDRVATDLENMEKRYQTEKSNGEYYRRNSQESDQELDEVHSFIDALPDAPARERDVEFAGRKSHVTLSAATRIAQWLILKKDK